MKKLDIKVGDRVNNIKYVSYEGISIPPGDYLIATALKNGSGKLITHYGIISELPLVGWGDLNGACPDCHGLWLDANTFTKHFTSSKFGRKRQIGGEFIFKRRDLKGKNCTLLSKLPNSNVAFVELEEDVDGCSADGLGKAGHCVLVPCKILKKSK